MLGTAVDSPRPRLLTVEDFYRMGEVGILQPDERVELIEGRIIDMPPPGNLHSGTVDQLATLLQRAVSECAIVRVQNPIVLDRYSQSQPDLALLVPRTDFYKSRTPQLADVLLVIEVADTSLAYDRDVKLPLYARYGIPEVWLVNVRAKRLIRFRDALSGTYARVDEPDVGVAIEPGALPGMTVDLGAVFAD